MDRGSGFYTFRVFYKIETPLYEIYINFKMPIIYGMTCKDPTKIYFGSTVRTKEQRFSHHKCCWKRWKDGRDDYCASFELFEIGDVEIHIVLDIPDDISKLELRQIEQIFLDNCECVNMQRAFQTPEQLKEYNKEQQKKFKQSEKYKAYTERYNKSENHKESMRKYMRKSRLLKKQIKDI